MKSVLATTFLALVFAAYSTNANAYLFTGFGPSQWFASDSTLGIQGLVIEDFEDLNLATGLTIEVDNDAPSGAKSVLDNIFDPINNDPNGNAFELGIWDGEHVLINTVDNLSKVYTDPLNWQKITFHFAGGVSTVGFSIQQMDFDVGLRINGNLVGLISTNLASEIATNGGRGGYFRIDAELGDPIINSITIDNTVQGANPGDGFAFDHLAFGTVPEPTSLALLGLGLAGIGFSRRKTI